MPQSYNGIGTHYYGKKNCDARIGVCQYCGAQRRLESYDTRLWFVVFFIPVIPLGRKRILDYCPGCTRHHVAELSQWEMSKQLNVSGALEQYRSQPSAETAAAFHGYLLAFHMRKEAAEFRQEALAAYPDSAQLHANLAEHLKQAGEHTEAIRLFEKALELRPDLPEARVGVAMARINSGDLDEARQLLAFLEEPGASQLYSLAPLDTLAYAYQQQGKHDLALQLCERLLAEYPQVAQVYKFRRFIATSERALRRRESILPKRTFSLRALFSSKSEQYAPGQRWLAIGGAVAVLVLIGLAAMNEYRRTHRGVLALNDCGQPAQVTIDDGTPVTVAAQEKLSLSEGRHHVKVTGPVSEEFDIELGTGYWQRWSHDPVWILNIGGAAPLVAQILHYAENPGPTENRLIVGENLTYLPHVDYLFEEPPHSLKGEHTSGEILKQRLVKLDYPPDILFRNALVKCDRQAALRFAETHLHCNPKNQDLLDAYVEAVNDTDQTTRAREFLAAGLWRSPPVIRWHRAYQELAKDAAATEQLLQRYDAELKQAPRDGGWLYLRGRMTDEPREAGDYFRRASEADPNCPWAWFALAYDASSQGNWQECQQLSERALALKLEEPSLRQMHQAACLATGNTEALEAQCRQKLSSGDAGEHISAVIALCELLIVQGKPMEARQLLTSWADTLPAEMRSPEVEQACNQTVWYMLGDFPALQKDLDAKEDPVNGELRLQVLAAQGKGRDIVADKRLESLLRDAWNRLAVSLAFQIAGDQEQAAVWRERACQGMKEEGRSSRRALALLERTTPLSQDELDDVRIYSNAKGMLLVDLAARFPEKRGEYTALARRLNVSRRPPYHLVQRLCESEK